MLKNKSNKIAGFIIGGALVFAVFLIASGGQVGSAPGGTLNHGNTGDIDNNEPPNENQLKALEGENNPILGDENAPVTLVEFGDYQCTFCTRFFKETEPDLIKNYVDTGKLKIVFRDLVVNGRESQTAAEAANCAQEQGKFWEYHDRLFNERRGYNVGVFTKENLVRYADELGLNTGQFEECYDSGKYKGDITADAGDARRFGATGTPTFFLNGVRIPGAQPYSVFENAIEQLLAQIEQS